MSRILSGFAKNSTHHLKGLRELKKDYPAVAERIVVCLEDTPRRTADGILILPFSDFIHRLSAGDLF